MSDITIEAAVKEVKQHFPNSRFRITIIDEHTPRGKRTKKSSASVAVFDNVIEEAPTLREAVTAICEWMERRP